MYTRGSQIGRGSTREYGILCRVCRYDDEMDLKLQVGRALAAVRRQEGELGGYIPVKLKHSREHDICSGGRWINIQGGQIFSG